jgi:hypothetical protein
MAKGKCRTRAKTKKGVRRAIHKYAKKLKSKKSHSHLTWSEAHGVATSIVTGKGPKKGKKGKRKKK